MLVPRDHSHGWIEIIVLCPDPLTCEPDYIGVGVGSAGLVLGGPLFWRFNKIHRCIKN